MGYDIREASNSLFRFGGPSNRTVVEDDGTIKFEGDATVWKDLLPTAVYTPTGSAAPNITTMPGGAGIKAQEFPDNNNSEEFNPSYQFPHEWKEDSLVGPHLHVFIPANGATPGVVKFKMAYIWDNVDVDGSSGNTPDIVHILYGTYNVAAFAIANPNAIISFGTLDGTGKKISSILSCKVTRELNSNGDTSNSSVWLKSADLHVECNTVGSRTAFTK